MPIIVLDGPEKAGKSTVSAILAEEYGARVRHFGAEPAAGEFYDLTFCRALAEDHSDPGLVVYDRSWASEVVYGSHYHRQRRLPRDPWLGEWLYGRVASTLGLRVVLLGPSAPELQALRTPDDHDLPAGLERVLFAGYATRWGWETRELPHDSASQRMYAGYLNNAAYRRAEASPLPPLHYVGPPRPQVLVVGESKNAWGQFPGGLAPFTSWYTTRFGRLFGREAMDFGWTNADALTDEALSQIGDPLVLACGAQARERLAPWSDTLEVVTVPHPAWFYRWGSTRPMVSTIETRLLARVRGRLGRAA